ncbi:hypothetical protein V8G54_007254 [Vigna mungo]|uniref:Uncharacterized protein n=1 Tax=Vigna mungo TaxID=3915 RepID=A0AAQ3P3G8_VIGMU
MTTHIVANFPKAFLSVLREPLQEAHVDEVSRGMTEHASSSSWLHRDAARPHSECQNVSVELVEGRPSFLALFFFDCPILSENAIHSDGLLACRRHSDTQDRFSIAALDSVVQKDNHANPSLQTLTPLLDEARRNLATMADLELVLEGGDHD